MQVPQCLNVRSDECVVVTTHGRRVVMYEGGEYSVIGLYFGQGRRGRRELRYVLTPIKDRDQRLTGPVDDGT